MKQCGGQFPCIHINICSIPTVRQNLMKKIPWMTYLPKPCTVSDYIVIFLSEIVIKLTLCIENDCYIVLRHILAKRLGCIAKCICLTASGSSDQQNMLRHDILINAEFALSVECFAREIHYGILYFFITIAEYRCSKNNLVIHFFLLSSYIE